MTTFFKTKFTRFMIPVFAALFFFSCQKDLDFITTDGILPDFTTKVNSSVSGFVTDENNAAVLGASVTAGGFSTTTDKYGYFEIKNVQVVKSAAVVTVNQPGYFKGIKTYIADDNKAAFFRIKLIPKTNVGSISATTGGNVTLTNGLIIALPVDGVVNAGTGAAYSGAVNVAAHWIDPTASDLNQTMPGDLRGTNAAGSLKRLTSFGMAAVELTGASGELLQIATGKKATITMPIPSALLATADATIILWSFDEAKGLWKEEGTATKTGNTYVGEVSHFSFWNCDVPNNYVQFNCTIKDQAGNPIPYAAVKISVVGGGPYNARYGYTDSSGYVSGAIPDNASLLLEVFTSYTCGTPVYSQNFATTNVNVSLGTITITSTLGTALVSGTVTDCSNNPVTNGYIIMLDGYQYYSYPLSNTGSFSFATVLCNSTATVTFIAEDNTSLQQSPPTNYTLTSGTNAIGNLQACGVSTQQFVTYSIDGGTTSTTFTAPVDSIYYAGTGTAAITYIGASSGSGAPTGEVYFQFDNPGIAVGSAQNLLNTYSSQMLTQATLSSPANVNITEYGAVGQFVAGNFTAVMTTATAPIITYNVVCSFRVRRSF